MDNDIHLIYLYSEKETSGVFEENLELKVAIRNDDFQRNTTLHCYSGTPPYGHLGNTVTFSTARKGKFKLA